MTYIQANDDNQRLKTENSKLHDWIIIISKAKVQIKSSPNFIA